MTSGVCSPDWGEGSDCGGQGQAAELGSGANSDQAGVHLGRGPSSCSRPQASTHCSFSSLACLASPPPRSKLTRIHRLARPPGLL